MRLSSEQVKFFSVFGFLKIEGVFKSEIVGIAKAFEEVWAVNGGGHAGMPHANRRSVLVPFIDRHPRLCALLDDERVLEVASPLLGDDFNYCTSDGNLRVGDTNYHSHVFYGGVRALKLGFYLDPVTRDSGCLRVIPGSHRFGDSFADDLHELFHGSGPSVGVPQIEIPATALESEPGDLVVFDHRVKHGAFGGGSRRRMFAVNLSQRFPDEKLPELRRMVGDIARFHVDSFYGQTMLDTAGPARMKHLEQVIANQYHLPALAASARASATEPARG